MEQIEYKITKDGSPTFYDRKAGEDHHSSIGAYTEARYKYVEPARIVFEEKLKQISPLSPSKKRFLRILDLPFGVGYNSVSTVKYLHENQLYSKDFQLQILGIENNQAVIRQIASFSEKVDSRLSSYFELISSLSYGSLLEEQTRFGFSLEIKLQKESLFQVLPELVKNNLEEFFDLIYFDPFSLRKNPEFWSREKVLFFLSKLLSSNGLLITYSSSQKVRKAFLDLGLKIAPSFPVGRKAPGTLAFKSTGIFLHKLASFSPLTMTKIKQAKILS